MKALYALYTEPDEVQRAVDNLRAAGIAESEITVISAEPIEEYEFSHRDSASWIFYMAGGGGVIGLLLGTWLTRMTELAWPLRTGNMPIVAWWPNMIVIFELTMLGAMLSTVITLFVTAKLPRPYPDLYDIEVSNGKILVGVNRPQDAAVPAIETALLASGGGLLKRN